MRTSDLVFCALFALSPFCACLSGGTCLRNSDCASTDVCSVGACIPAPADDGADASVEGGTTGTNTDGSTAADVSVASDAARPADAGSDSAPDAGDASAE
jgi:hypothetical protein